MYNWYTVAFTMFTDSSTYYDIYLADVADPYVNCFKYRKNQIQHHGELVNQPKED